MTGQLIMGLIIGLPLVLGLLFRVSMSHLFFSLMAGELLGRYFGGDVELLAGAASPGVDATGYGEIVLLILPMLLTAFFLKGSISKGKVILHILPLIVTGIVFAAFLAPILPPELRRELQSFSLGEQLLHLNKLIIGSMVGIQLLALWLLNRGADNHKNRGE